MQKKLDLAKIKIGGSGGKVTDPRKLFTTLNRLPKFKRPLDEQADVMDGWYAQRAQKR